MNKKINQKKYLEALNFAFKLHSKQFRKGTKIPYFFHLSAVSNHVIENGGDTYEVVLEIDTETLSFLLKQARAKA